MPTGKVSRLCGIAAFCCAAHRASAQGVLIAPQAVFIDAVSGTGAITLVNPGRERIELSIWTIYGYPVTDSTGTMRLETFAAVDDTMPSAATWLESYPRRLTLDGGARRTVRLLVTPPARVADGEYWARLVISSREAAPVLAPVLNASQVSVNLDLEVRSIVPVLVRKGVVKTSLDVGTIAMSRSGDSLAVRPSLKRRGNAAWVGTVRAELLDEQGTTRGRTELPLAVYYSLAPRLALSVRSLPAGMYTLRFDAVGQRADISGGLLLPTVPVTRRVSVTVP